VIDPAAVAHGQSAIGSALAADIERAARTDAHVFIVGEGDAGPNVVARLIHRRSRRSAAPMLILGCAGLPDTLLESELFGHLRGSFPGAYRDKPGLLEMATTGTLFLDDVAEMSARLQAALLRFIIRATSSAWVPTAPTAMSTCGSSRPTVESAIADRVRWFREDLTMA
jgi:transcriptional regulator with GAF, ATPase, and Fis domain